jgi:hypothetical protein
MLSAQCQRHAEAIRVLGKRIARDIIEIGERLIEVKGALPHGAWLPWIDAEFGWSQQTARNFMDVADRFGSLKSQDIGDFTIEASALYALSGPKVDQQLREAVVEAAQSTGKITVEESNRIAAEMVAAKVKELNGHDVSAFIVSSNLARRNLTKGQPAADDRRAAFAPVSGRMACALRLWHVLRVLRERSVRALRVAFTRYPVVQASFPYRYNIKWLRLIAIYPRERFSAMMGP